ncbi:acetate--CoA ligase family protein [Hydrogenophaga sp. BPS33]|uniref:acetate--CoA ligase family protein n=1 Tax=Hydrogenophaga sp. BPS33 TaxID=2651974 RepID=UPI00131FC6DA|nr:acetate--CoA ligase family protein [Hydrogenophaga sp. BPS33]QHE84161.1 acetate--CoA ligase family protein [Hydrogenophaga sp. BPS33]
MDTSVAAPRATPAEVATPASPRLLQHDDLRRVLHPESIAIVGASDRPGSFSERVMVNLAHFKGRVYMVNPKYAQIGEHKCYPSVSALPEAVDAVVFVASREAAEDTVRECVAAGVGGVVMFASGFAETGKPEHVALQERLRQLVAGSSTRLIGPNCIGIYNYVNGARMAFSPPVSQPRLAGHAFAIASQSGAMGSALSQAIEHGVSISHTLTSGNACDVDVADLVSYLVDDPNCQSILCIFEGMQDPRRLLEAARRAWEADKPLIVYKMATGVKGGQAALSHTGSLAGSNEMYAAAFRRYNVIALNRLEDLVETAAFFAKAPRRCLADGVAVVSTSGGAAIMAADKAEEHGVPLPDLLPGTEAFLGTLLPEFGSAKNPCDLTGQVLNNPQSIAACADALLDEETIGTLLYPHPLSYDGASWRFDLLSQAAAQRGKCFVTVWINEWLEGPGIREAEANPNAIVFRSMDRAFQALSAWQHRSRMRAQAEAQVRTVSAQGREAARALLQSLPRGRALTEREAKNLLACYGIPVTTDRLAASASEAVALAEQMGYPVVLKLESPDVLHKTEAGVVKLNLQDPQQVVAAYEDIVQRTARIAPPPRVQGVAVQPMIESGIELMVGGRVDSALGPVVLVGWGGVMVEVLQDAVTEMAPVSRQQAGQMIEQLKVSHLLQGYRGSAPVDVGHLQEIVCAVSEFLADFAQEIGEIDINPLICTPRRIIAVDALVTRP